MANAYDMAWGDVGAAQTPYVTLDAGRQGNRLRIVSQPSKVFIDWERKVDGKNQKVICPGSGCPICETGAKAQVRYALLVLDKKNWTKEAGYGQEGPKVKLLETGITVVRAIRDLAMSPLYGDPKGYDILIKKEGTGRETKYTVLADPDKTALTPDEQAAIEDAQTVQEIEKASTPEEIYNMGLTCLGATPAAVEEASAPVQQGKSANATSQTESDWNSF